LVVSLIPLFLFMYWSFVGGGSTSYKVLALNEDRGECALLGSQRSCASEVIGALDSITYRTKDRLLHVREVTSRQAGEAILRENRAAAMVVFPEGFSQAASSGLQPATVTIVGDPNNPYYTVAAVTINATLDEFAWKAVGLERPVVAEERMLGGSGGRTEFETYTPGLLVAAVTLILFSVAISISREVEYGTIRRLVMTGASSTSFLGGITGVYTLVGLITVLLAYGVATALGFRSLGPIWVGILVSVLTSVASIGLGLVTACFSRTVARAAVIANFPLLLVLFFSNAMFPLPGARLFAVGQRVIHLQDVLPQTHAVVALNKVFSLGLGLREVTFEMAALVVLAFAYFMAGTWLFRRMHMRAN